MLHFSGFISALLDTTRVGHGAGQGWSRVLGVRCFQGHSPTNFLIINIFSSNLDMTQSLQTSALLVLRGANVRAKSG